MEKGEKMQCGTGEQLHHLAIWFTLVKQKRGLYFEYFEYSEQICQGDFKVIRLQVLGHSLPTQLWSHLGSKPT